MKGDLHIHTNISDGSESYEEVINKAKDKGLTHIAITNHDTVRGLREAINYGEKVGIKVIPGIEISAYDFKNNRKVHILGYNMSLDGFNINNLCYKTLINRNSASTEQISKLLCEGYDVDFSYISKVSEKSRIIYKQHIMDALKSKHYCDGIYCDLYRKLFKNNGICAIDIEYVDAVKAVEAIQNDGGVAVLAHPGQLNSYSMIVELVKHGLWGIEVYHHSHNEEDVKRVKEYAKKYNLHLTGGTDYHGRYNDFPIEIGDITAPEEVLSLL